MFDTDNESSSDEDSSKSESDEESTDTDDDSTDEESSEVSSKSVDSDPRESLDKVATRVRMLLLKMHLPTLKTHRVVAVKTASFGRRGVRKIFRKRSK